METNKIVDVLVSLAQLDIDAVHAYGQALQQIDITEIYDMISRFQNDHHQHIEDLSRMIMSYGGKPPKFSLDFKGYLINGMTAVRSLTGAKGALEAMETNEITTNSSYRSAIEDNPGLPADVLELLEKNYADEKKHLEYIRDTIQKWEQIYS